MIKLKKIFRNLFILLSLVLVFTSCGNQDAETPEETAKETEVVEEKEQKTEEEKEEEKPEEKEKNEDEAEEILKELLVKTEEFEVTEDSVIFADDSDRGEKVEIKKNPERVAVLYGSFAPLWIENGGEVAIGVGGKSAVETYKEQIGRDITEDEDMVVVAESSSGKSWDIEKILAEEPDLIICSTQMNGYATISGPAKAANIPVIAMSYNGVEDYLKWSKIFSTINGQEELFETGALEVAKDIANIISKIPDENNPEVLSIFPNEKGPKANLANSNMGAIIEDLKAINVADNFPGEVSADRVDINIEDIYAANPEYILIQIFKSEEYSRDNIENAFGDDPIWAELEAVKNGEVYYMPKNLYHLRPNERYNDAYLMMAELLYPEIDFSE